MSYKQKKQPRRKSKKYKSSKKTNTKSRDSVRTSNKPTSRKPYNSEALSLSPFYSFSNHWSYLTRQYLCLSTWGTCMGGVNEQYDDLLDQEASIPLAEESYRRAINKWQQQRDDINKYNKENANKYERIRDDQLEKAYNITNENKYNEMNVFNYPTTNNIYNQHNTYNKPKPQPPLIQPMPKQLPILNQSHRVPEYSYVPNTNNSIAVENVQNTENIYNVYNTYNTITSDNEYNIYEDNENNMYNKPANVKYDKAANISNNNYSGGGDTETMQSRNIYSSNEIREENNMYNKPSNVKYDKAANISNNNYSGGGDTETMQSQNIYPSNENKESLEDKMYKSGSDGSDNNSPMLIKKDNVNNQYLASPDHSSKNNNNEAAEHRKGKSFGRKFSMFEEAAELKKRRTIEQKEWTKQHHGKDFKPYDGDGVQYVENFTYHPAAHHVQPHMPRKMSTKEYSAFMKEKEQPDAIITDNDVAALPATEKIKMFTMLSTDKSIEKQ